jgi:hypothetical protein
MYSWCNLWHLYFHCAKCQFSHGMRITTCTSFNHVQLLLSTNQHCAHQKWHSHPSWHYHCQPNASGFTSPILHNSRICYLRCGSNQKKELSQLTPHWSIPPFSNWSIWMSTQTSCCIFTQLCQCHLELERARRPSFLCLGYFSS